MRLKKVHIQNFRGIRDLELEFDDVTVLIGENNTGKTAVLDALRLCLRELGGRGRVVFEAFDFHLKDDKAEPAGADPICITVTFAEAAAGAWDDARIRRLGGIVQVAADSGRGFVTLRVTCGFDPVKGDFDQDWGFLNEAGQALQKVSAGLRALQDEVAYHLLTALRDAARNFDPKGPFWRPFLKDSQLPPAKKTEIEAKLQEVNALVVSSHTSFDQAIDHLKTIQKVVPMAAGDVVSIEAVPGRMFDMLSKAQVHLGTATGAKVPVGRHGEGTQSLAVLMLFSAFLDAWPKGAPIVALEEPEAHLHPSAVRALWGVITGITGQKLISTHSGDLLSEVPATALRRLARTNGNVTAHRLQPGTLTADDERKFNFHIRHARGELLFARCWLLVEGETEVTLLPVIARHLGLNLEREGVRCVQHRHAGLEVFLKVARDLGIRWCVVADNDSQGAADKKHVKQYAGAAGMGVADVLHVMPENDIEQHLCAAGFGDVYQAIYDAHPNLHGAVHANGAPCPTCGKGPKAKPQLTASPGDADYWPQLLKVIKNVMSKPVAALDVLQRIETGAVPAPPMLVNAVRKAVELARGA